jgi:hypothetical protein
MRTTLHGFSFPAVGRILLDPDPPASAGGSEGSEGMASSQTAAPEVGFSPSDQGAGSIAAAPAGGGAVGDGAVAAGAALASGTDTQAATNWLSIRDAAREYGLDLSSHATDRDALLHLVGEARRAQEANYYAQLGQAIAPHAEDVRTFLNERRAANEKPKVSEFEPPAFDDRWLALVDRDPQTGLFVGKPGVPAEIVKGVNEYARWQERFQKNPVEFFQGYQSKVLPDLVSKEVDRRLAEFETQRAIDEIVRTNTPWLYQKDQNGHPLMVNGQKVPTPAGVAYMQAVSMLRGSGVSDPRTQDQLARQLLVAQAYQAQAAAPPPVAPAQAAGAAMAPSVNPLQANDPARRAVTPGATEPVTDGLSLVEIMRRNFSSSGISDADFSMGIGG